MKLQWNPKILLVVNAIGAVLAIAVALLLFEIDGIVNVSLYGYGLQFSDEWAIPYWMFLQLALGLVGGIACVNVFAIVYEILGRKIVPTPKAVKPRLSPAPAPRLKSAPKVVEEKKLVREDDGVQIAAIPMVCNKCGKVFTQPLCMFDFKSGKPRLVNVCPYCNAILAVSGNSRSE
ncbi:MAG: hypothetical protein NWE91_04005 [Candidatus Bathyarchaeota archaeon]|nr:hypothetical protein [Candidatus Bathyarchaeota archaeon]